MNPFDDVELAPVPFAVALCYLDIDGIHSAWCDIAIAKDGMIAVEMVRESFLRSFDADGEPRPKVLDWDVCMVRQSILLQGRAS